MSVSRAILPALFLVSALTAVAASDASDRERNVQSRLDEAKRKLESLRKDRELEKEWSAYLQAHRDRIEELKKAIEAERAWADGIPVDRCPAITEKGLLCGKEVVAGMWYCSDHADPVRDEAARQADRENLDRTQPMKQFDLGEDDRSAARSRKDEVSLYVPQASEPGSRKPKRTTEVPVEEPKDEFGFGRLVVAVVALSGAGLIIRLLLMSLKSGASPKSAGRAVGRYGKSAS